MDVEQSLEPTARLNSVEAIMERLCVGRSTVYQLLGSGELRSVKVGKRRLITESALIDFIEKLDAGIADDWGSDCDDEGGDVHSGNGPT
jgi:excisionase family DNA binding protein